MLKPGGRLFILDPVIVAADDALDAAVNGLVNEVFQRSPGAGFRFYSVDEICRLMTDGGLEIVRADRQTYTVDQDGIDGIPIGRHWIEVVDELERQPAEIQGPLRRHGTFVTRRRPAGFTSAAASTMV